MKATTLLLEVQHGFRISRQFDFTTGTRADRLSYLSQCKQCTNASRLSNLTLVTFCLGKNSNVNTA